MGTQFTVKWQKSKDFTTPDNLGHQYLFYRSAALLAAEKGKVRGSILVLLRQVNLQKMLVRVRYTANEGHGMPCPYRCWEGREGEQRGEPGRQRGNSSETLTKAGRIHGSRLTGTMSNPIRAPFLNSFTWRLASGSASSTSQRRCSAETTSRPPTDRITSPIINPATSAGLP